MASILGGVFWGILAVFWDVRSIHDCSSSFLLLVFSLISLIVTCFLALEDVQRWLQHGRPRKRASERSERREGSAGDVSRC